MSDRPTLKSLSESVEQLHAAIGRMTTTPDFEGSIAGKCAAALDSLVKHAETQSRSGYGSSSNYLVPFNSGGSTYNYQPLYEAPRGPVPRVLDYLRQRYGLPDPSTEAQRLSAELDRAYRRIGDLEDRLQRISGAVSS